MNVRIGEVKSKKEFLERNLSKICLEVLLYHGIFRWMNKLGAGNNKKGEEDPSPFEKNRMRTLRLVRQDFERVAEQLVRDRGRIEKAAKL
jgi:hypothetical protein